MKLTLRGSFEHTKYDIERRVRIALENARPKRETDQALHEEEEFTRDVVHGKKKLTGERSLLEGPHTVQLRNLGELIFTLNFLGLPRDRVEALLAHENAHMSRVQAHAHAGWKAKYTIMFTKHMQDGKEALGFFPTVSIEYPDGVSKQEFDRVSLDILSAPDDLSEHDKRAIERLKKEESA